MMYWSYPSVTSADRLRRAPTLNPSQIKRSPEEAFDGRSQPSFVLLASFDGRPVYIGDATVIYADDGSEQLTVDSGMIDRAAAAWVGRPTSEATKQTITGIDQWTLDGQTRGAGPLFKYSWADGQQVYVEGATADVVQYTTRESRFWAYLGAITHWFYIPAFRAHEKQWLSVVVWSALGAAATASLGAVSAVWMYSPRRRYRQAGRPTGIPYSGWKRWHMIAGLTFGLITTTWLVSGALSLEPFAWVERLTTLRVSQANRDSSREALASWSKMAAVLRGGRLDFAAYAGKPPGAVIEAMPGIEVKELQYISFAGQPAYLVTSGSGNTRVVPVRGDWLDGLNADALIQRMREAGGEHVAAIRLMENYDAFYRDRTGARPLPVISIRMNDALASRYYVDPKTATLIETYSEREWVKRWLINGLHSLDFPWLYNRRPLWDIVVIALMAGGTALCVTSLVLTWRSVVRNLGLEGPKRDA